MKNIETLSQFETLNIIPKFFNECLQFWNRDKKNYKEAFTLAVKDVELLERDPYIPYGKLLDKEVKERFILATREYLDKE